MPWSKTSKHGKQLAEHIALERGACIALMLNLPSASKGTYTVVLARGPPTV